MEEILKQILEGQNQLAKEIQSLKNGQQQLTKRLDIIEQDMGTKNQQDETIQIVKTIQHNSEVLNAKLDGLTVTTASKEALTNLATKEAIADLSAQFRVLNDRLFRQEVEVDKLKIAK